MKMKRMSKRVLSAILALTLILTACFQYGFGAKAAEAGTPTDVQVTQVLSGHSGNQMSIFLSESDYVELSILGEMHTEYSYWTDILVYSSETEYKPLNEVAAHGDYYYGLAGPNSINLNMQGAETTAVKIVIPAGTVFPAVAYTGGVGAAWGPKEIAATSTAMNGYRVTRDTILTRPDAYNAKWGETDIYSWNIEYGAYEKEKENVTLENIHFRWDGSAYNLLLMQSSHDHESVAANTVIADTDRLAQYNTLDYITFTKGDNTEITLRDCFSGTAQYNIWNESSKPVSYKLKDFVKTDYITKITVKAGCELPSYAFTSGATSIQKTYVVTQDTVFTNNEAARDDGFYVSFTKTETKPERATTEVAVNKLTIGENGNLIKFVLSDSDYNAAGNTYIVGSTHTEYNYLEQIKLFVNDQDFYYLKDGNINGQVYYNMFVDNENSFSFECQQDIKNATVKIEIPAGTVFPSAAYTGATQYDAFGNGIIEQTEYGLGGFETTKTVTFVKPESGHEWIIQADESVTTDITNIHIRRNGESDDYRLMFLLTESDFSTVTSNTEIDAAKIEAYNLLDSVFLYDEDGNEYKLRDVKTDKYYYTSFNEANSIGIGIDPTLPVIVQVKAVAGTEFPQYAYTHEGADKHAYYIENDNIFTVTSLPSDNSFSTVWTKEEVLPKEEVGTKVNNIHVRDGGTDNGTRLLLLLSNDDYGTATDGPAIENKKFEKYNTLNYITLETTLGEIYTLSEVYGETQNYNLWELDCLNVKLTDGLNPICKVTVKAGCEFPSRAFTEGTADTQLTYVVKNDTIFTINNPTDNNWNITWNREEILPLEEVQTTISDIHVRTGDETRLMFFLGTNDYGTTDVNYAISTSVMEKYNILDKVKLYTTAGEEYTLSEVYGDGALFNSWGDCGTFAAYLDSGLNPIYKVVIETGAQFPSMAYTKGTADSQLTYVLTEDTAFICNTTPTDNSWSTNWQKSIILPEVRETTKISNVHVRGGETDYRLMLFLSNHDYEQQLDINFSKLKDYNMLDYISLYDANDNEIVLNTVDEERAYYKCWGDADSIGIGIDETIAVITKVKIKAGCELPSQDYTNGSPSQKTIYVVENDTTFTLNSVPSDNTWSVNWNRDEVLPVEERATDVNNIHIRTGDNTELLLFLSNHDYGTEYFAINASVISKYNTLDNIVLKTTEGKELTLADVYGDAAYFNLWEKGSVALQLKSGIAPICEVTIKAGCELPSKAYADGTGDTQLTYVVQEDITFTCNETPENNGFNISWTKEEVYPVETINTDIKNIHVRTGDYPELLLFLSNHDYGTTSESMNVSQLVKYNMLDNILLYTATGSVYTLRQLYDNAAFYNIWNEAGSVAIQFDDSVGVISKVYIKAGCELPSKEFTNGDNPTRKLTYVVESDIIFTVKQIPDSNTTTVHWDKANPRTIETDVNKIVFADNILGIYLNKSDYGSSKILMSGKHANYNYLNQIRMYTSDTEYITLAEALGEGEAWFNADNSLQFTVNVTPIRIVIPAYVVFPTKAYVDGTKQEMSGYEISNEKIFELSDGTWKDVSVPVSRLYGDANGDNKISALDLVRMKKYFRDGYGMNNFGNCDDDASVNENDIVLLRKSMVGSYTLHPYVKQSSSLTYFISQDGNMDYFLNDYFKRHAGYVDYVEGEMTATSYRPGETFEGMFNTQWVMEASTWYSSQGFDIDTAEKLREWLDKVPVDKYGYVWDGNDIVEDSNTDLAYAKHAMGWPLPNANDANTDTSDLSVYWDFNDGFNASNNRELGCVWTNNVSASASNGLYTGNASGKAEVYFEVKDYAVLDYLRSSIVQTEYAPWLAIDLRMTMDDLSAIDDIYVWYTTSRSESYSTAKRISVKETAPIWYDMKGTSYEHMLYVPMYTQDGWYSGDGTSAKTGASDIYKIKIQIVPKSGSTLTGTFALNYVRPSFDTRYSNNNALFISTIKEYYNATGDTQFLKEYITKARKAMNFLMRMYDDDKNLNKQSYLFGHYGSTTELYDGMVNGYWDVTYTPVYDFQSNMYFYEALRDLVYLENKLTEAGLTVNESAAVSTASIDGIGTSEYAYDLDQVTTNLLTAVRSTFWNGTRFVAGKDNSGNVADNGHVVWNLQAIESGIATEEQADAIMTWIDGESDMYQFGLAPMTNTIDNETSNMYSSFYQHTNMSSNGIGAFGQNVQNGGAAMYSSYYDLMSRLQVNGTEDAYNRLTAIRDWYLPIANAYDYQTEEAKDFYYNYFNEQGKVYYYLQNGARDVDGDGVHDCGNGIIGLDGEFPESLLALAAVPRGFFGVENIGTDCMGLTPSLPSELQHWKIENMEFHNVKYDVSLFDGIVRVDSVEGDTTGLTIQITLDYTQGQKVYINEVETTNYKVENGKAIVTVDFDDVVVEVR